MRLFLDTEFADPEANELVSLALISEDGSHEFYAERDPLPSEPTLFVLRHIYPLLERGAAALDDTNFTKRLRGFLNVLEEPHVIYDFPGDWRLLSHAIYGFDLPRDVARTLGSLPDVVVTLLQGTDVSDHIETWFAQNPDAKRHHALVDAKALRLAWCRANARMD